ncbi:MAG: orotidine 5'-phosphate decarboxylase [Candidatus Omnitrophica bacterium CG1_02_49_10]|nr:MAG: orotidine 5'-phosphate decarboxylase [Candidatus Omnitrophica bacterium CG1_02_49_10]
MKDRLIVALDVASFKEAKRLVDKLYPAVKIFKVGSQLFTACGTDIIKYVNKKGAKVFLDLKYHDIPNTVKNAVASALEHNIFMLTVHVSGGTDMMKAAVAAKKKRRYPIIVGVTVLTSKSASGAKVLECVKEAAKAGLDGVVCSPLEAGEVRRKSKRGFVIVTPGIRLAGSGKDDQRRTASPEAAIKAGADYIVVGRPIVEAKDPLKAANHTINSMIEF